jgi:hypothetical protein
MKRLLLLPFVFLLAACEPQEFPDMSGEYAGRWVSGDSDLFVRGVVSKPAKNANSELAASFSFQAKGREWRLELARDQESKLLLRGNLFGVKEIELTPRGGCADGRVDDTTIELCWTARSLSFLRRLADGAVSEGLVLDRNDGLPQFGDEQRAVRLSLDEALERARTATYREAQEAERLYRARNNIRIARRNLLPRVSGRSVVSWVLFPVSGFGLIDTIGNLVPFLFPGNWYKIQQAEHLAEAARYSYASLVANEVNLVETLYYVVARDQELVARTEAFLEKARGLLRSAEEMERLGLTDGKPAAEIRSSLRDLENDLAQLRYLLAEELSQFGSALAVQPVGSIAALEEVLLPDLGRARPSDAASIAARGKLRAPEIASLQWLSRASRMELEAQSYAFVTPSDFFSIDFTLGPRNKSVLSSLREIGARIDEHYASIEVNAGSLARKESLILETERSLYVAEREKEENLARLRRLADSRPVSPVELYYAERAAYEAGFRRAENAYQFLVVRAQIQRLVLAGAYSAIVTVPSGPTGAGK